MPEPHAYGCECEQCRAMIAAVCAMTDDGSPFYTDDELQVIAMQHDRRCECDLCCDLREN